MVNYDFFKVQKRLRTLSKSNVHMNVKLNSFFMFDIITIKDIINILCDNILWKFLLKSLETFSRTFEGKYNFPTI